jgi:hypothetical protein
MKVINADCNLDKSIELSSRVMLKDEFCGSTNISFRCPEFAKFKNQD